MQSLRTKKSKFDKSKLMALIQKHDHGLLTDLKTLRQQLCYVQTEQQFNSLKETLKVNMSMLIVYLVFI